MAADILIYVVILYPVLRNFEMNSYSYLELPAEIILHICTFLSSRDLANICGAIPHWRLVLNSPAGVRLLERPVVSWQWLDQDLSRLLSHRNSEYFDNLVKAIHCRHQKDTESHQQRTTTSFPNRNPSVQCAVLGPAVDGYDLVMQFYHNFLFDMYASVGFRVDCFRLVVQPEGWTSYDIHIRPPMTAKKMYPPHFHVKDNVSREALLFQFSDRSLMKNGRLTKESVSFISSTGFVIYAVECRRTRSHWHEIRTELREILRVMTAQQKLLVLGLCRRDQMETDVLSPIEIVQIIDSVDGGPLALAKANWRVWCVSSDGQRYTNVKEIFEWACMELHPKKPHNKHCNAKSKWNVLCILLILLSLLFLIIVHFTK